MIARTLRLSVLSLVVIAGCFSLDLSDGTVKCNGQSCPEGYFCAGDGYCYRNGHTPPGPDMAMISACGDTSSDAQNCGSCGHDCTMLSNVLTTVGVTCSAGHCDVPLSACRAGFAHCSSNSDDGCETDLSQASHCGSCNACPAATPLCSSNGTGTGSYTCTASCQSPTPDLCGSTCTNLQTDPNHCKTCGVTCTYPHAGALCTQGTCAMGTCASGYMDCNIDPSDGCETLVMGSDINNCGGCGTKCKVGQVCKTGSCQENQVTCSSPGITCAQAACYEAGRYSISAGGTIVVDLNNGRRLYSRATRGPLVHPQADTDCSGLVLEGINGWRLPTSAELTTTRYKNDTPAHQCSVCNPAVDQAAFNDVKNQSAQSFSYQTSTFNTGQNGWQEIIYCADTTSVDNATPAIFFCTHDPLP